MSGTKRLLIALAAALLSGCYYWDMRADAWALAESMCASHGGLVGADETHAQGGGSVVNAGCADGTNTRKLLRRK